MLAKLKEVFWSYFSHKAQMYARAADYLLDLEYFPVDSYSHARGTYFKAKEQLYLALAEAFR